MDLASAIAATAVNLGIDPLDLATAISYETSGTWDPWQAGPTTQYGQHRGLIQWGEPQQARYGVSQGMPVGAQMDAVGRYLHDAGVRPGMGLLDIYSAINAGQVGRYRASDANSGGAPGNVADKVRGMGDHRINAQRFMGGQAAPQPGMSSPMVPKGAPIAVALPPPGRPAGGSPIGAALAGLGAGLEASLPEVQAPEMVPSGPLAAMDVANQGKMRLNGLKEQLFPARRPISTALDPMKMIAASRGPQTASVFASG